MMQLQPVTVIALIIAAIYIAFGLNFAHMIYAGRKPKRLIIQILLVIFWLPLIILAHEIGDD